MNKKTIKITDYANGMKRYVTGEPAPKEYSDRQLSIYLEKVVGLRSARVIGDVETINHTMLGKLRDSGIQFEIV